MFKIYDTMAQTFKTGDHVSWNSKAGVYQEQLLKFMNQILLTKVTPIMQTKPIHSMKLKVINQVTLLHTKHQH